MDGQVERSQDPAVRPPVESPAARPSRSRATFVAALVGMATALAVLIAVRLGDAPTTRPAATAGSTSAPAHRSEPMIGTVPTGPSALDGVRFVEASATAGIEPSSAPRTEQNPLGSSVAVADIDGDGDPDVLATRSGAANHLYVNDGAGRFHDRTPSSGIASPGPKAEAGPVAFADVDGDGRPDLFVGGGVDTETTLYRNDGNARFTKVPAPGLATLDDRPSSTLMSVAFADITNDGWLDLVAVSNDHTGITNQADNGSAATRCTTPLTFEAGSSRSGVEVFENDRHGGFIDRTRDLGLGSLRVLGYGVQIADIDGNGWQDLLVTGDVCTSKVLLNGGPSGFTDATAATGGGTDENGMGAVLADVDDDGLADWFVTAIAYPTESGRCPIASGLNGCSGNRLYLGGPGGRFTDGTDRFGLREGGWGWGAAIEDFDNDGVSEVASTNAWGGMGPIPELSDGRRRDTAVGSNQLRYWYPTSGTYAPVSGRVVGLSGVGDGPVMVPVDVDRDGRLDVITSGPNGLHLYRNESTPRPWITVRLHDATNPGNADGIGARVVVETASPSHRHVGWITSAGSFRSQRPAELHVGLATPGATIAAVEVWWPGSPEPQRIDGVASNQVLRVERLGPATEGGR